MSDHVTAYLLKRKIQLTQRAWIRHAYLGAQSTVEELEGEELADLPENFEDWPVDETTRVN